MTSPNRLAHAAACGAILLLAACAESPRRAAPQGLYESTLANFKQADANGDEQLTREELTAGMPQLAAHFDEIDTDHNGKVNFAELWSYTQFRYMRRIDDERQREYRR